MERKLGKVLITGATGFLGGATVRRLLAEHVAVQAVGRKAALGANLGCPFQSVDLADGEAMLRVTAGCQTVIHCGALSSPWGPRAAFQQANVLGTANVLRACRIQGVMRLIHISTPSLYFRHGDGLNVREDAPLPPPLNHYARTKREAEALVQASTVPHLILRPRALFGEGDPSLLPRLLGALQRGQLKIIGDGQNLTDLTYIENAVDGVLLAARAPDSLAGRIYNLTNGEPQPLWPLLVDLAGWLEMPLAPGHVPRSVAMFAATLMELTHRLGLSSGEPRLTRYGVGVLSSSQTLDITAARRDLGYAPRIPVREGLRRYAAWWKQRA